MKSINQPLRLLLYTLIFLTLLTSCLEEGSDVDSSVSLAAKDFTVTIGRFAPTTTRTYDFSVDNSSTSEPTPDLSYSWKMGDGSEYNDCCVQHTYSQFGVYNVSLLITGASEEIIIERTVSVGKTDKDVINGFGSKPKLYSKVLLNGGTKLCLEERFDPCQNYPEVCCLDDDIWAFKSDKITHYQNTYNDCICLDVDENPVQDGTISGSDNIDFFFNGDPSRDDLTTAVINDGRFTITRSNGWKDQFDVVYDCETMNEIAQQNLTLTTGDACGCGFFNLLTNSGTEHVVTYINKKVGDEVFESMRLELDPGETVNLDCNKICLGEEKDIEIEFSCTDYFTPVF